MQFIIDIYVWIFKKQIFKSLLTKILLSIIFTIQNK